MRNDWPFEDVPVRCTVCDVDSTGGTYLAFITEHAGCGDRIAR